MATRQQIKRLLKKLETEGSWCRCDCNGCVEHEFYGGEEKQVLPILIGDILDLFYHSYGGLHFKNSPPGYMHCYVDASFVLGAWSKFGFTKSLQEIIKESGYSESGELKSEPVRGLVDYLIKCSKYL